MNTLDLQVRQGNLDAIPEERAELYEWLRTPEWMQEVGLLSITQVSTTLDRLVLRASTRLHAVPEARIAAIKAAARWSDEDRLALQDTFGLIQRTGYQAAIGAQLAALGAYHLRPTWADEVEMRALTVHASDHAASVVRTYNSLLDNEIDRLAAAHPDAGVHDYAGWLFLILGCWWTEHYISWKRDQIGYTEAATGINAALRAFYTHNGAADGPAEIRPYPTVCARCAAAVAGNPYDSIADIYAQWNLPLHPGCPHHGERSSRVVLTAEQLGTLWTG